MKNYNSPEVKIIDEFIESVYASSGEPGPGPNPGPGPDPGPGPNPGPRPDPGPGPNPSGDWDIHCEYRNHNSGSHSEVAIIAINKGQKSGDNLKMDFRVGSDIKLSYVKDSSGYLVSNVTETGFTIYRNGHFNPNERIEFNIQIVVSYTSHPHKNDHLGAVGITGDYCPCSIECYSYEAS